MKILTLGDSWTYGTNSSDPDTMSWPAQMAKKYQVQVVNLARPGSSNQRAARIGTEELCRNSNYDYVIWPLCPASRYEILKHGKWHQIWPNSSDDASPIDKLWTDIWHPWNDVQYTIHLCFNFINTAKCLNVPLFITGLSAGPKKWHKELGWIMDYQNNYDFNSLAMPLDELDIGVKDLDRKLKTLKSLHEYNLRNQPEYLTCVTSSYLQSNEVQKKYQYMYQTGHPSDRGYEALADYFADKIGLI